LGRKERTPKWGKIITIVLGHTKKTTGERRKKRRRKRERGMAQGTDKWAERGRKQWIVRTGGVARVNGFTTPRKRN